MIGVYAGRFDPPTNGHIDIACRAARLFDELVVAVYDLPPERCLFSTDQRVAMLQASLPADAPISVEPFSGSLTDFVRRRGAGTIVRGLRAVTDFSAEFDQALMYKDLAPDLEQIYLMTALRYIFLSASRIREVAALGHDVSGFVPAAVAEQLRHRFYSP
jgi:pantetheine-phosphate adenylyltransferase